MSISDAQPGSPPLADELAWALALIAGDERALGRYEEEIVPYVQAALQRRGHDSDAIAEVQQVLRVRLLVDGDSPARLRQYQARAPLKSWVAVCAVREASQLRKRDEKNSEHDEDEFLDEMASFDDLAIRAPRASIEQMKVAYAETFRDAFRTAFRGLSDRHRLLLRMTVSDGRSLDEVSPIFRVHPSTLSRWLDKARKELFSETRRAMMKSLQADPFEVDSILELIHSRLDASLAATVA